MQKSDFRSTGIYVEPLGKNDTRFDVIDSTGQKINVNIQGNLKVTGNFEVIGSYTGFLNYDRYRIGSSQTIINPEHIKPYIFMDNGNGDYNEFRFSPMPLEFDGKVFTWYTEYAAQYYHVRLLSTDNTSSTPIPGMAYRGTVKFDGKFDYWDGNSWESTVKDADTDAFNENNIYVYHKNAYTFLIQTSLVEGTTNQYNTKLYVVNTAGTNRYY